MSETTENEDHDRNSISGKDPTTQVAAETSEQANETNVEKAFQEIYAHTRHIRTQADRMVEHLLEPPTTERRDAARMLLAQIGQILRNQALLTSLVEDIHRRLPPALPADASANPPAEGSSRPPAAANQP